MLSTPKWSVTLHFQQKWGYQEVNEAWFQGPFGLGSFSDPREEH